jgi:hypothetical protein
LTSDQLLSEHVVVQCPACGAAESLEAASLVGEATIVCRECGETWHAAPTKPIPVPAKHRRRRLRRRPRARPEGEVLVAEKRSVVTYSDQADTAWKAKIDGDYWPEPPRQSRLPMIASAVAAVFFLAAFFGGREAAVAALPDLAGLYAAIGLPVNLDEFAIENVGADRTPTFAGFKLKVHATLKNIGHAERKIPPLAAILYTEAMVPEGAYGFDPPAEKLKAGQSIALVLELESAPKQAAEVKVRFRRPGETLAVAGAAQTASR